MKFPIVTGSLPSHDHACKEKDSVSEKFEKLETGDDFATTDETALISISKLFNVEAGTGSAQSGSVTGTKAGIEKEPKAPVSSTEATPETEYVYLVYHSHWGETPKRIDRAYRTSDEAIEYCRNETRTRGIFWVDTDDLIIGDGLWALRTCTRNDSYVVEKQPLNKEAPIGLRMGGEYGKSHPRNVYVVVALQSGIVPTKPVFWTTNMSVLAVCKDRVRAHEVRFGYCEDLETINEGNVFVKEGETWAIDVTKCVLY